MDSGGFSGSDSPESSSEEKFSDDDVKCTADRMVSIELEAAEVLAGFASSAIRERCNPGKRVSQQRVEDESSAKNSGKDLENFVPRSSDLAQVQVKNEATINTIKVEQGAELSKSSPLCTTNYSRGSKSRNNLTEAEKEARKLRRILANRESARQTIRRRQALCEELTRKAADLKLENGNLKKEREVAMKKYVSVKNTNEQLKIQVENTINARFEETLPKSTHVEISTAPSTSNPVFVYKQPFTQFLWSPIFQSPNPIQSENNSQNFAFVSSDAPVSESTLNTDIPRIPLYSVPYPWFFPHNHWNEYQLEHCKDKPNGALANEPCSSTTVSTSKATENTETNTRFPIAKPEASTSIESDFHQTLFGFPPDGGGQHVGPHMSYGAPEQRSKLEAFGSKSSRVLTSPEKKQEVGVYGSKRPVDTVAAAAAAEARKRRKELTKLKNHGRQFRTNG